jgi:hypothetical protein
MAPSNQKPDKQERKQMIRIGNICFAIALAFSIGVSQAARPASKYSTPTLSCGTSAASYIEVQVCAGTTGAPAGFSVQWESAADFAIYGWSELTPSYCAASFSGVPGNSRYNLAPNSCITVQIGDNLFDDVGASSSCAGTSLACGTQYVFRAFAHATSGVNRSDFSSTLTCETLPCNPSGGCTFTQGFWKTHGPLGCVTGNNTNLWPVTSLALGNTTYDDTQLCAIFNTPAGGNGLISLAHQLIAAKLNVANGADVTAIASAINDADALIGSLVVPPIGSGSLNPSATSTLIAALTSFNEGLIGPGHCQ